MFSSRNAIHYSLLSDDRRPYPFRLPVCPSCFLWQHASLPYISGMIENQCSLLLYCFDCFDIFKLFHTDILIKNNMKNKNHQVAKHDGIWISKKQKINVCIINIPFFIKLKNLFNKQIILSEAERIMENIILSRWRYHQLLREFTVTLIIHKSRDSINKLLPVII